MDPSSSAARKGQAMWREWVIWRSRRKAFSGDHSCSEPLLYHCKRPFRPRWRRPSPPRVVWPLHLDAGERRDMNPAGEPSDNIRVQGPRISRRACPPRGHSQSHWCRTDPAASILVHHRLDTYGEERPLRRVRVRPLSGHVTMILVNSETSRVSSRLLVFPAWR